MKKSVFGTMSLFTIFCVALGSSLQAHASPVEVVQPLKASATHHVYYYGTEPITVSSVVLTISSVPVALNDAIFIEVPANIIGFYSFAYPLDAGIRKFITPVAHGPPNAHADS